MYNQPQPKKSWPIWIVAGISGLGVFIVSLFLFVGLFTACSSSSATVQGQCETYIPDYVECVANIDLSRLADATDTKVKDNGSIELNSQLESLMRKSMGRSDRRMLDVITEFKGFGFKNVLLAADIDKERALVISPVDDEEAFIRSLRDLPDANFDTAPEVDGYKVVENGRIVIVVKDNLAFLAGDGNDKVTEGRQAVKLIERWREDAGEEHLADWKINYLAEENAGAVIVNAKFFYKTYLMNQSGFRDINENAVPDWVGLTCDLDKEQIKASVDCFNNEGAPFNMEGIAKFDTSLLDYATSQDMMVYGLGLDPKTFPEMMSQLCTMGGGSAGDAAALKDLASKFKGSVMIAAGPTEGLNSFARANISNWHFVFAANADGYALKDYLEKQGLRFNADGTMDLPVQGEYNWETGDFEYKTMHVYSKIDSKVFVISNSPISTTGNSKLDKSVFDGKCFGCWAVIDRKSEMLESINAPFGLMITGQIDSEGNSAEVAVHCTSTDKTFFEAVLDLVAGNI